MMSFQAYFLKLAEYNQWANQQLYAVLNILDDSQLHQLQPNFFDSIIKTANHIWVGDTLWLGRIDGNQPAKYQLDSVVFQDIKSLTTARVQLDQEIIEYIHNLTEQDILGKVSYSRLGELLQENLYDVLAHIFNHQTHHRGQLHSMVFAMMGQSLALDMIYFQRTNSVN